MSDKIKSITRPPCTLDIVIPVLNEELLIGICLDAVDTAIINSAQVSTAPSGRTCTASPLFIGSLQSHVNVIVVDGGSDDGTVRVAEDHGAKLLHVRQRGRGRQIAAGIEAGSGDLVLILHADALIAPGALSQLFSMFQDEPSLAWGILGHRYDKESLGLKLIASLNRFRFKLRGIAFGDQGMFVRRRCLEDIGGMPPISLMEDVELSLRLNRYPRRMCPKPLLTVSARRWETKNFLAHTVRVIILVTIYCCCRRREHNPEALADMLYRRYYG